MTTSDHTLTSSALIVLGDHLEPELVTRSLGVFPDQAWRRGERPIIKTPSGRFIPHPMISEWGGWKRFLPENLISEPIECQLAYWVETLEPKAAAIREMIAAGHTIKIDIFFSSSDCQVIELPSGLLRTLGELGIDVVINVYPHN